MSVWCASDSVPHSSPEGEVLASGFWHSGTGVAPGNVPRLGMDVSLAPGRCLSVSTFYGWFSILKVLILKCRVLPFSGVSYAARVISCGTGVLSSLSPFRGCLSGSSELGWGSVELLQTSDVRVFFSDCTLRPGLGLD